jgi:hypothetical protein
MNLVSNAFLPFSFYTEVSDQNFADDEAEVDAESSKACKRRKLRSALTRNYQVISQDFN